MNKISILGFVLALAAGSAHATYCPDGSLIASHPNGDCSKTTPPPKPDMHIPTPVSRSQSDSAANANAAAAAAAASKATSGSNSTSNATGGAGGSVGPVSATGAGGAGGRSASKSDATGGASSSDNSLGSVGNDNSSSSFRAYAISLPPPASTPPLPATCPAADVTQSSRSFGWGLATWADSHSDTSDCTLMTLRREAHEECQFETSQSLNTAIVRKHVKDFPDSSKAWINMSPDECKLYHDIHSGQQVVTNNYNTYNYVSTVAAEKPARKPQLKKRVAAAHPCHIEQQAVLVCKK